MDGVQESNPDRPRFLIVGTGRSGSTLLAGVLAGAGARFNMARVTNWNPRSGEYEHPLIHSARRWQSRAEKIKASLIPDILGRRFCVRRMQRDLRALLGEAEFVKSTDLIWLVHPIFRLGFPMRIIVSYRPFADYARSRYVRYGWNVADLVKSYRDVYSTAALQLHVYGGCAINYDDLVTPDQTAWADALAQLTGIARDSLLNSRAEIVRKRDASKPPLFDMTALDGSISLLYQVLEDLRGRVIEPE